MARSFALTHRRDRFISRQHRMGQKAVVDDRRLVAIALYWMPRSGDGILHHGNLETLLKELAQMRLDAYVRQHAAEDDLADPALAQLQDQIVGLRPEHLVRADDDGLPVFDVRLEAVEPV